MIFLNLFSPSIEYAAASSTVKHNFWLGNKFILLIVLTTFIYRKAVHIFGDIIIVANGQQRLSRNEVIAQVNNSNKLFTGTDTVGSHATVYIDDVATRRLLGFEEDGKPQKVFTEQLVKDLFAMSQAKYEAALPKYIRTRAEKYAFIEAIKKLKLNDYAKMVFASNYTGYKL